MSERLTLVDAYRVIENINGFDDETTMAGEAWVEIKFEIESLRSQLAALTRERETLCTISTGVSAANDGLKKEIAILTRANADLTARVEEQTDLLNGLYVYFAGGGWFRPGNQKMTIKEILSIPTPGAADRLRIEGMEIAAKITSEWKREIVLSDCCDVAQDDACIGIADAIRSRIAEMEKGEGE